MKKRLVKLILWWRDPQGDLAADIVAGVGYNPWPRQHWTNRTIRYLEKKS